MNAVVKSPPTAARPETASVPPSAAGGSGAQVANRQQSLVGNQSVMRSLDPEESATAAPRGSLDLPIYWGWDTTKEPRLYYVTIPPPGRALAEVAAFLYGTPGAAAELHASNPGKSDFLPRGTTLRLTGGPLAPTAQQSLGESLRSGMILRTTGVPDSATPAPDAQVVHLKIGEQTYDLLEPQYQALLRGLAWHLGIRADYVKGMCEVYLDTRNEHVNENSSVVRGISDWMGDVSVPDESVYAGPRDRAKAIMDDLAKGEPTTESIKDASRRIRAVADEEHAGERAWHIYIEGTISGAGKTAAGLEVVRNTCFAIEAGLAGAVVAPLAFAAVGGGALGVGAAVGAGAVAGGTLRGGLEVALPGMGADKPVSQRFVTGFKSGAIQGGIGAVGALVAPGVSGALAPRLGIAADVAPTVAQRLALGVSTGVVIGAPSGAAASALTNAGALYDGKMSTLEYLISIAKGAGEGAAGGALFGALPIKGLYKSGGQPLNPFSGEPVIPAWMLAGPYSPLQAGWNPPPEFNALTPNELPPLPEGYGWAKIDDAWHPISLTGPNRLTLSLRTSGADAAGRTNFDILSSGQPAVPKPAPELAAPQVDARPVPKGETEPAAPHVEAKSAPQGETEPAAPHVEAKPALKGETAPPAPDVGAKPVPKGETEAAVPKPEAKAQEEVAPKVEPKKTGVQPEAKATEGQEAKKPPPESPEPNQGTAAKGDAVAAPTEKEIAALRQEEAQLRKDLIEDKRQLVNEEGTAWDYAQAEKNLAEYQKENPNAKPNDEEFIDLKRKAREAARGKESAERYVDVRKKKITDAEKRLSEIEDAKRNYFGAKVWRRVALKNPADPNINNRKGLVGELSESDKLGEAGFRPRGDTVDPAKVKTIEEFEATLAERGGKQNIDGVYDKQTGDVLDYVLTDSKASGDPKAPPTGAGELSRMTTGQGERQLSDVWIDRHIESKGLDPQEVANIRAGLEKLGEAVPVKQMDGSTKLVRVRKVYTQTDPNGTRFYEVKNAGPTDVTIDGKEWDPFK